MARARWPVSQAALASLGVTTPCLVVDDDVLEQNLVRMADDMARRGVALRPHFKTHKTFEVARRQLALGAAGMSCATLEEARVLVEAVCDDVFIAYPLWADDLKASNLRDLQSRAHITVGVDSTAGAERLAVATRGHSQLEVMIEVDSGLRRSGVAPSDAGAIALAATAQGLRVVGVFTYPGHAYRGPDAVGQAAADEARALGDACEALVGVGLSVPVASGGSTPSAQWTVGERVTEIRPGVYAFNDRQQVALGTCTEADVALAVLATVVSSAATGSVVVDAGSKALSSDKLSWMQGYGVVAGAPECVVGALWEHHGVISDATAPDRVQVGDVVAIIPNHVCSVVNLFDELVVIGEGRPPRRWAVRARSSLG